jgi:hypothetical protein
MITFKPQPTLEPKPDIKTNIKKPPKENPENEQKENPCH